MRILFVFILACYLYPSHCQSFQNKSEQEAYFLLDKKQQKTIDNANKTLKGVNGLSDKIITLEAEKQDLENSNDKKVQKKKESLEQEISALQIKYYKQSAELKHEKAAVYQQGIINFLEKNSDNDAAVKKNVGDDYFNTGERMLMDAKDTKAPAVKLDQYQTADMQFSQAIISYTEGLTKTSGDVYNEALSESTLEPVYSNTPSSEMDIESVLVNEELLEIYKRFSSNQLITEDSIYLVSKGSWQHELFNRLNTHSEIEGLYFVEPESYDDEIFTPVIQEVNTPAYTAEVRATTNNTPENNLGQDNMVDPNRQQESQNDDTSEVYSVIEKPGPAKTRIDEVSANTVVPQATSTDKLWFSVQIAASKRPLTIEEVMARYKGEYPVYVIYEDGWYKYQIGKTRVYRNISGLVKDCGVTDAYIVSYLNGKREPVWEVRAKSIFTLDETEYFVQIAASRTPLQMRDLSLIYQAADYALKLEEGWYKYQLPCGTDRKKALNIRTSITVSGAFLVGYKKGVKQNN